MRRWGFPKSGGTPGERYRECIFLCTVFNVESMGVLGDNFTDTDRLLGYSPLLTLISFLFFALALPLPLILNELVEVGLSDACALNGSLASSGDRAGKAGGKCDQGSQGSYDLL